MRDGNLGSKRIEWLDGLRASAFLLIFTAHTFHAYAWSGYLTFGVPVFFVLSGFLIGRILLGMKEKSGSLSAKLKAFYMRRALRIFPPYYALLLVIALAPLLHITLMGTRHVLLWHALYLTNLLVVAGHGWGDWGIQGHFWSLAVEEQFYLACPLLLLTMPINSLSRSFLVVFAGLIAFRLWDGLFASPTLKFLPFCWLDYLLCGLAAAIVDRQGRFLRWFGKDAGRLGVRAGAWMLALFALPLLPSGWFWLLNAYAWWLSPQRISDALLPLFVSVSIACLILAAPPLVQKALSWPPLRALGRISYACYLWHLFVVAALEKWIALHTSLPLLGQDIVIVAAGLPVTVGLALLSWHLIENPLLRLRDAEMTKSQEHTSTRNRLVETLHCSPSRQLPRSSTKRFRE